MMHDDNVILSTKFVDLLVLNCMSNLLVAFSIHVVLLE